MHRHQLLALVVLLTSLAATLWLYASLKHSELQGMQRYADTLGVAIHDEVISRTRQQMLAQRRIAARLGDESLGNEAGWRADAQRYQAHHPYYRAMAVLDAELRIRWLVSRGEPEFAQGEYFPVDEDYRQVLGSALGSSQQVVTRPFALRDERPGISFFTPLVADGEAMGFLVAVLVIPEAFEAMLPTAYRAAVTMRVTSHGAEVYPLAATGQPEDAGAVLSEFRLDADGDGEGFKARVALTSATAARLASALPATVLGAGIALSLLLSVAGLLAVEAGMQARQQARSNKLLRSEMREREQAQRELQFLATHDSLTGLPNRVGTQQYLESLLGRRLNGVLAVLFLDLDQFKDINDTLGHQVGDRLLAQIPQRLRGVLHSSDFIGRQSGDEFLIIVEREDREAIRQLAADILKVLDASFSIDANRLFIAASIGVAVHPEAGLSVGDLIRNADTALFKAKRSGRNQFRVFTRELFGEVQHRLHLSRDIRQALEGDEFSVVYQPIIRLADDSLAGLEALLRWRRADGRDVPPQEFIRVAEDTGLIGRLSDVALRRAFADYAVWRKRGTAMPWLAVNISGAQIREASFPQQVRTLLDEYQLDAAMLHLEITEDVLIENLARNRRVLQDLDDTGIRICVDDFGVGYSSLGYLKNFPVSVVKIDRGFVANLARDREDQAITRTICSLALDLGMQTVAEGIEDEDQLALLRGYRCTYAQGFLFSRPLPAAGIEPLLVGNRPWSRLAPASSG